MLRHARFAPLLVLALLAGCSDGGKAAAEAAVEATAKTITPLKFEATRYAPKQLEKVEATLLKAREKLHDKDFTGAAALAGEVGTMVKAMAASIEERKAALGKEYQQAAAEAGQQVAAARQKLDELLAAEKLPKGLDAAKVERAKAGLAAAEVVLFDALTDPALRDLAPRARWIDVGKRGFRDSTRQVAINAQLVRHAQSGRAVVRLKGGDPSVFGRLEEELAALAHAGIAAEVVPGVTAAIAAAAATQRPLTRRGSGRSVSLATAMTRSGELQATRSADTEVFYMAGRQLGALGRRLRQAGWSGDTPVLVVSRAAWPDQLASDHCVATLAEAGVLHAGRPSVVTVGIGATPIAAAPRRVPEAAQGPARQDAQLQP